MPFNVAFLWDGSLEVVGRFVCEGYVLGRCIFCAWFGTRRDGARAKEGERLVDERNLMEKVLDKQQDEV